MKKRAINPPGLPEPIGFAHAWLVEHAGQRTLYLAGQIGQRAAGPIESPGDLVAQLDRALANIGLVLAAADMGFEDVVQLQLFVTRRNDYALARKALGKAWRERCGRHFPAMALFEVGSLLDPEALIEIQGIAVAG